MILIISNNQKSLTLKYKIKNQIITVKNIKNYESLIFLFGPQFVQGQKKNIMWIIRTKINNFKFKRLNWKWFIFEWLQTYLS